MGTGFFYFLKAFIEKLTNLCNVVFEFVQEKQREFKKKK